VLPTLRERLRFERPYLKLDTQGFDMEVLRGGSDSLSTVPALQREASVIGIYKGMPTYMETIRHIGERGFHLSGLYPVARDSSLRLFEFDCVMIRTIDGPPIPNQAAGSRYPLSERSDQGNITTVAGHQSQNLTH